MKRTRGHVMLELALSAGVMITALAGTFQFGYSFYVYNQLVTAVGNGGRYAAFRNFRAASDADVEKGKTAIRNMVVYGNPTPATQAPPVVANLTPENVRVEWVREARWVEDGRFATSSGVSAGIDMALAVIAKLAGSQVSDTLAVATEYDWHRDANWDPFAKVHGLV